MAITGGELLLDLLQACGVEYVFCSPGTEWTPVWEGLLQRQQRGDDSLKYINCRDEILAVSMAQGYAEVSGGLPAVLLHAGVGPLHGALAMRNAFTARVPMIIFGGETCEHCGDEEVHAQGWHWLGLLADIGGPAALVKNYVKWSNGIQTREGLVDSVYRGCQIAMSAPSGPVFVSVPAELLQRSGEGSARPYPVTGGVEPCLADLKEAAARLVSAQRPVIIAERAGNGPGAVASLVALSELLSIPVFESSLPYAASFPKDNPLYMGIGVAGALQEADTVLVVNAVTPWYPPAAGPPENATVIFLDEAPLHERLPYWGYRANAIITADTGRALAALVDLVRREAGSGETPAEIRERRGYWLSRHGDLVAQLEREALEGRDNRPIAVRWFLRQARETLPSDAIILDETLTHSRYIHQYLAEPGRYIKAAYGGLGVSMGEALGVKLASPDRPVVLMIGDGSFNYNPVLAALGLGQEYGLPVFVMVFDNGGYMAMRLGYRRLYPQGAGVIQGRFLGTDITPTPDYTKIAEAFGAFGERLENPEDIPAAIGRGLRQIEQGRTALLDVALEITEPFMPPA